MGAYLFCLHCPLGSCTVGVLKYIYIYIYKSPLLSSSSLYNNIYICAQDWWQAKKLATGELGYIPTGFIQPVQNTNETGKRSAPPPPKATAAAAAVAPQPAFVVRNHSLFY